MRDDLDSVFEELEPPRDGLAELRARIAAERRRRTLLWQLQVAGVAAMVVLIAAVVFFPAPRPSRSPIAGSSPMAIRLGLADAPREPVVVPPERRREMAARRVAVDDDRVVFYLVAPRISETGPG